MDKPIATPPPPAQSNQLALILGMHRSGTSVLTHLLSQAGFYIGRQEDLLPASEWNRNGYFERRSIALANDLILKHCGGSWDCPPPKEAIERVRIDTTLQRLVAEYSGHPRAAIKDPRLCLTLPVWQRVLGPGVRVILIRRDEAAVAASLMVRNGFSREKCRGLIDQYHERAEYYVGGFPVLRMTYEALFTDNRPRVLGELQRFLGIATDLEAIAAQIVDPAQRHHKAGSDDRIRETAASLAAHPLP